jgi:hypothetical protein
MLVGSDRDMPPPTHGFRRVLYKVGPHLVELAAIGPYLWQGLLVVPLYGLTPWSLWPRMVSVLSSPSRTSVSP